jgi:hypothetical protein
LPVSGLLHPRGPEAAAVYWRRRALVLGVVVVILGLAANALRGGDEPAAAASAPGVVVLVSPTQEATTPAVTALPTESAAPAPTVDADGNVLCTSDMVRVTAAVDRKSTPVGIGVHIKMSVKNTSATDCTRDVGSGANEIVITRSGDTVWSSDHCNPSADTDDAKLPAGGTWSVTVVWNGKVTGRGCAIKGDAQPGTYSVKARNGTTTSSRATFTVS